MDHPNQSFPEDKTNSIASTTANSQITTSTTNQLSSISQKTKSPIRFFTATTPPSTDYDDNTDSSFGIGGNTFVPAISGGYSATQQVFDEQLAQAKRDSELKSLNVKVGIMFASKAFLQLLTNPIIGPLTNLYVR